MPIPLRIFISHVRDVDKQAASDVAAAVGAFGGSNVIIYTSQQFTPGTDWQQRIKQRLKETDWILFIYTNPKNAYELAYYEIGCFGALPKEASRLICLHSPMLKPPETLRDLEDIPATPIDIEKLLYDIYVNEPWKINPEYGSPEKKDQRDDHILKIKNAVIGSPPSEVKRFTWSIRIDILPSSLPAWHESGVIPDEALVTGEGPWEQALGKAVNSGSWTWKDLIGDMPRRNAWVPILADALRAAEHGGPPSREVSLPRPSQAGITYHLMVHKCETTKATGELQFHLIIAPLPPQFDPAAVDSFSILNHLIALAWHFRWRIINKHTAEVKDLRNLKQNPRREESNYTDRVKQLTREFQADMLVIGIDAEIRGVTNAERVLDAFKEYSQTPPGTDLTEQSKNDVDTLSPLMLNVWPTLHSELEMAMNIGEAGLERTLTLINTANEMNKTFFERSARRYWELSRNLR
jgi:hypothetical protein